MRYNHDKSNGFNSAVAMLCPTDLVAVLQAYFDESYNHRTVQAQDDPLVYTVACWLAPVRAWQRFGQQWDKILKDVGIEHFHMKDYESRKGEYASWSNDKRIKTLNRLHQTIRRNIIYGCSFSADKEAYDEVMTPEIARAFATKTVYGNAVFSCMDQVSLWCHQNNIQGSIHYIFAQLTKQGGDLDRIFGRALKNPEVKGKLRLESTWSKGFAKDVPQLQAADILAYEINKRAVNMYGRSPQFVRKSLQNMQLTAGGRFYAGFLAQAGLEQMVRDLRGGRLPGFAL